ncbi:MAG: hypothetical protein ACKO0M_01895 [Cyanobium sp.]
MLTSLLELLWLILFLQHVAGPASRRDSGWIVLADILYWLLIAIPLWLLFCALIPDLEVTNVLGSSIRQAVNGIFNVTIALTFFLLIRLQQSRAGGQTGVSLRGLSFITLLLAMLIPSLISLFLDSRQYQQLRTTQELNRLRQSSVRILALEASAPEQRAAAAPWAGPTPAFQLVDAGGRLRHDSNPALFRRIDQQYRSHVLWSLRHLDSLELMLATPTDSSPSLSGDAYWRYRSSRDHGPDVGPPGFSPTGVRSLVVLESADAYWRDLSG